ncbi:hypothetical protein AUG19_03840 [archaeon 13_1_20CM_2_54_9]|nr:MAG: hypothetical protein AUG19_03840 [archaeon 13_1_20CM_2_54_9]
MRAVGLEAAMSLVWGFLALLYVSTDGLEPVPVALLAAFFTIFGAGMNVRLERSLERKGEYRPSRKTLALAILAGAGFLAVLFTGVIPALSRPIIGSFYLGIAVAWATRLILLWRWEAKTKRRIYVEGTWVGRFYLVPPGPLQPAPA